LTNRIKILIEKSNITYFLKESFTSLIIIFNKKGVFMDNKKLLKKIAKLESKLDLLETEYEYLNKILIECGFSKGIITLKETIIELLSENKISI
jgi:hypothetical protein